MKTRTITGIFIFAVYSLVLALTIYVDKFFYDIFVLLLMIGASLEVCRAVKKKFTRPLDFIVVVYAISGYIAFYVARNVLSINSGITVYFAVLAIMFIISIFISMFSKTVTMQNVISTTLAMIYPVTVLVYMLGLNYLPGSTATLNISAILLMFAVCILTDVFAYLVGVTFKGPKLCPSISPKKTISGAVGGLLGGILGAGIILLCSIFGWLKVPVLSDSTALNIVHYLVLGTIGSIFTQLGDLIASYFKRQCDVKDFGKLMPGHGGVMDRIDGMMLNAVFIYVYMMILSF